MNFNICGRFQVTLVSPYPVQLKCVNASVTSKLLYCLHAAGFNATASKKLDAVHCRVAACGRFSASTQSNDSSAKVSVAAGSLCAGTLLLQGQMLHIHRLAMLPNDRPCRQIILQPDDVLPLRKRGHPAAGDHTMLRPVVLHGDNTQWPNWSVRTLTGVTLALASNECSICAMPTCNCARGRLSLSLSL